MPVLTNKFEYQAVEPIDLHGEALQRLETRLDLIESNVLALPGIVTEALLESVQQFSCDVGSVPGFRVDEHGCTLRDQYGAEAKASVQVDLSTAFKKFYWSLGAELKKRINFEELVRLRKRVLELEEDLGYRRKVAERLMEEPKGNRRT